MLKTITGFYRIATVGKNRGFITALTYVILTIWCLYVEFYQRYYHLNLTPLTQSQRFMGQMVAVVVLIGVFIAIYQSVMDQVLVLFLGAAVMLAAGHMIGFYDYMTAMQSVNATTIAFVFGMGIISITLTESKVLHLICHKMIGMFGRNNYALFVSCCLLTYVLSLFLNNIATMLLILPMTAILTSALGLSLVPFVAGEIIASNLGGASSMLGGFPSILVATSLKIPFQSFFKMALPICLINLAIMFMFFFAKVDFQDKSQEKLDITFPEVTILNPGVLAMQVAILLIMIGMFMVSSIHPGLVALAGSFFIYMMSADRDKILEKLRYNDVAIFVVLFVFVGGINASGLPQTAIDFLSYLSFGNKFLLCIVLMWVACFITMFLNAAPSTAFFMPLFLGIHSNFSQELVLWALLLGVCAGSSGTLVGAPAGPISYSFIQKLGRGGGIKKQTKLFKEYLQYGMPIAYLHLVTSTIYITILYLMGG